MLPVILFFLCSAASAIGSLVGAGGGVIIKPVMDMLGLLPVATVSFLSGCTVLAMSVASLIRTRNNGIKLELRTSTPLAIGAAVGGIVGKWLFEQARHSTCHPETLGVVQAVCLTVITFLVFLYVCNKDRLPSRNTESVPTALLIGLVLGVISSFLGIGGGTSNIAVLFFFFSMDAKTAAKNSIYIILFSQVASILMAVVDGTVPPFHWSQLLCMAAGGVGGALLGAAISPKISTRNVEQMLKILLVVILCINAYNVLQFILL